MRLSRISIRFRLPTQSKSLVLRGLAIAISKPQAGDEEATMATLSSRRALVDELIGRHRGRIANTAGDSVLAEFASVVGAVHCAVEIQEALARANDGEPDGRRMLFRIGVNVGDVMFREGDIFGDGVADLLVMGAYPHPLV